MDKIQKQRISNSFDIWNFGGFLNREGSTLVKFRSSVSYMLRKKVFARTKIERDSYFNWINLMGLKTNHFQKEVQNVHPLNHI